MIEIANALLLEGDKFMSEMNLRQANILRFTYSGCGPFTKNIDRLPEAAVHRRSYEKEFWKYSAHLQKSTHREVRFQ